jgi:hypothetical protein
LSGELPHLGIVSIPLSLYAMAVEDDRCSQDAGAGGRGINAGAMDANAGAGAGEEPIATHRAIPLWGRNAFAAGKPIGGCARVDCVIRVAICIALGAKGLHAREPCGGRDCRAVLTGSGKKEKDTAAGGLGCRKDIGKFGNCAAWTIGPTAGRAIPTLFCNCCGAQNGNR